MARIDAHLLSDLNVVFFNCLIFNLPRTLSIRPSHESAQVAHKTNGAIIQEAPCSDQILTPPVSALRCVSRAAYRMVFTIMLKCYLCPSYSTILNHLLAIPTRASPLLDYTTGSTFSALEPFA
jgi:hypothetical protein